MVDELTKAVGKVNIVPPKSDYKTYHANVDLLKNSEFPHVSINQCLLIIINICAFTGARMLEFPHGISDARFNGTFCTLRKGIGF